jgi:hypothetical protein
MTMTEPAVTSAREVLDRHIALHDRLAHPSEYLKRLFAGAAESVLENEGQGESRARMMFYPYGAKAADPDHRPGGRRLIMKNGKPRPTHCPHCRRKAELRLLPGRGLLCDRCFEKELRKIGRAGPGMMRRGQ